MPKSTNALATPLRDELDRLAAFEPTTWPVVSLYLNAQPNQHGRDEYDTFLRKMFGERLKSYRPSTGARRSLERDAERIQTYLAGELRKSSNGVAIFACAAEHDFFSALQFDAPLEEHALVISDRPHLYPLARLNDQYPRYAAAVVDTNAARIFVFALGATEARADVKGVKTKKSSQGGMAQARYQRHLEQYHLQHIKEIADTLTRIVRQEQIQHVLLAGDAVALPVLQTQLPREIVERVVDVLALDINAPERTVLETTLERLRERDAQTDVDKVEALLGGWRGGGLAVVGADATLNALQQGQVEELLITAQPQQLDPASPESGLRSAVQPVVEAAAGSAQVPPGTVATADHLVQLAQQNAARITFIEDGALLDDIGGVGAFLRFKI